MKKKFEIPELTIVFFEGDLVTDVVSTSGDYGDGNGDWVDPEDPDD